MLIIEKDISEAIDLKTMLMEAFTRDRRMLVKLFTEMGSKEFRFIEFSGGFFGVLFGLLLSSFWWGYREPWILSVGGVFVGAFTNWLALTLIFAPTTAVKLGPFVLQGLFVKRRAEVARDMSSMMAEELLNPKNVVEALLKGPASDKWFDLIQREVKRVVDPLARANGSGRPFMRLTIGTKRYIEMKVHAVERMALHMPRALERVHAYADEAMDIESQIRENMAGLSEKEFAGIMRPIFQDDEWQLVSLGALLGFAVGFAQSSFFFGVSW